VCQRGEDAYVGKIVEDGLTTDRVDDVQRNVLSIMQRLCPDARLPAKLEILACAPPGGTGDPAVEQPPEKEKPSFEGF
jgi:hypothetical protein